MLRWISGISIRGSYGPYSIGRVRCSGRPGIVDIILDGLGECDLQAAADALVSNLSMLSPKATFERYSPTVISTRSG